MLKARLSDPDILKSSFDAISGIIDEVQMIAKEDGIYMDAIDRSHITFVHLELKNELFDEYSVDGEEK